MGSRQFVAARVVGSTNASASLLARFGVETEASGLAQGDKTAIEVLLSAVPCVAL
jgi:hypothetical protein